MAVEEEEEAAPNIELAVKEKDIEANEEPTKLGEISGESRMSVLKVNKDEKREIKEDLEVDKIARTTPVRVFMSAVWLICLGVFLFFLYGISTQYITGKTQPSSSITYINADNLPLPKVVVCNWNQDGSAQNPAPTHNCPTCLLTLQSCSSLYCTDPQNSCNSDCYSAWAHTPIQTFAGLFDCYTYNGDYKDVIWSNHTGYSGSIATIWSVLPLGPSDPPSNRVGAQVSFFLNDGTETSASLIYSEYRYCPVGFDSFFAVTFINTQHLEDNPPPGVPLNSSRYSTVSSTINLISNSNISYFGVSFAFQDLSEEIDTFFTGYTLQNFWGDFSGMVGTVMGLDVIKVCSGFYVAWVAFKVKSINPLEDHYNG